MGNGSYKVVLKHINGRSLFIRENTPDLAVAKASFNNEFIALKRLLKHASKNILIIDLGGYIGSAAIELSQIPNSTVVTLEPSPENFRLLKLNVAGYSNIIPINAAIGSSCRKASLYARHTGEWGHTLVDAPKDCFKPEECGQVDVLTMEYLLETYLSDGKALGALKIDIEGGEVELLENALWLKNFPIVLAELHDRIIDGCTKAWKEAVQSLDGRVEVFQGGEKKLSVDSELLAKITHVPVSAAANEAATFAVLGFSDAFLAEKRSRSSMQYLYASLTCNSAKTIIYGVESEDNLIAGLSSVIFVDSRSDSFDVLKGIGQHIFISLGEVDKWGKPQGTYEISAAKSYVEKPWTFDVQQNISKSGAGVIIKGRFRLACAYKALTFYNECNFVCVDKYFARSGLKVISEFGSLVLRYGDAGVFLPNSTRYDEDRYVQYLNNSL